MEREREHASGAPIHNLQIHIFFRSIQLLQRKFFRESLLARQHKKEERWDKRMERRAEVYVMSQQQRSSTKYEGKSFKKALGIAMFSIWRATKKNDADFSQWNSYIFNMKVTLDKDAQIL